MKLFSDDAVMINPAGRHAGVEEIRTFVEHFIVPNQLRFELNDLSSEGNIVTYTTKEYNWNDQLIDTTHDSLDVVVNGRIIFEGTESDLRSECDRDPSQAFCPGN